MKHLLLCLSMGFIIITIAYTLSSCNNGENMPGTIDTLTAGISRKGVIWDKKKVVQIPLSLEENNMKGKVKTVTYTHYKFEDRNGQKEKLQDANGYNTYNEWGYLTQQNEYDADGKVKWHCNYAYNANNKPLE